MLDFGFYNMDCMEGMKQFPDNYFDLAIVDPPYGDGGHMEATRQEQVRRGLRQVSQEPDSTARVIRTGGTWASKFGEKIISWDVAPKQDYFNELFRISRNQIIWGGQLLQFAVNTLFSDMAKDQCSRKLFGNVSFAPYQKATCWR